jgi:hypothetical protein
LVWDTETTTDFTQRLLFGFYRVYEDDELVEGGEGLIIADDLSKSELEFAQSWALNHNLPVRTHLEFVEQVLYPEVYGLGTLCVGFNLPFDVSRIAIHAAFGTGKNRRKFTFSMSQRVRWPRLRVEPISGSGAFIGFAPKKLLARWEKPFFAGRFLDLSTLVKAFTGEGMTLKRACKVFGAKQQKMKAPPLGKVTNENLTYGRQDVLATWSLYQRLRGEYLSHPFSTMDNERSQASNTRPFTKIFSTASIAKQYLRLMGFTPLLQKEPRFDRNILGIAAAAYYGGRAETRVRCVDVPVTVLDFTSMYPTVFILQKLQRLLAARKIKAVDATTRVQAWLEQLTAEQLFEQKAWEHLTCLVNLRPADDILPVRFKVEHDEPYRIAVTNHRSEQAYWYTLADVAASVIRTGKTPRIERAVEFVAVGVEPLKSVKFRGARILDPTKEIFKTVVEERQRAKGALRNSTDLELARTELALKIFANSGCYGIYFEINVTPPPMNSPTTGTVYSDIAFDSDDVKDERPGDYCNPIIASFITGAARLVLAMLENEVERAGGTFAFCDTDSLAIVSGDNPPMRVPCIPRSTIESIITKFDALNPYDRALVPHLLKVEYADAEGLRCFSVSAKRYVLFTLHSRGRIRIVKASESGLGGIIGRTDTETTRKLARRIWRCILETELGLNPETTRCDRRRKSILLDFRVPLRRKFPLAQPRILKTAGFSHFNRPKKYSARIKPFGFIQSVTPAYGVDAIQPIAPYERDLRKARKLTWIDLRTGKIVKPDWTRDGRAGAFPVLQIDEFIDRFRRHPEMKAAASDGNPADESATGVLGLLQIKSVRPDHVGKEIDRLDEDEGISLEADGPIVYAHGGREEADLAEAVALLRGCKGNWVAAMLGITSRQWRRIGNGHSRAGKATQAAIIRLARNLGTA